MNSFVPTKQRLQTLQQTGLLKNKMASKACTSQIKEQLFSSSFHACFL
jgi:hypothetical protein